MATTEESAETRPVVRGYDPRRPNHFYEDGLGDPMTCTGEHNHDSEDFDDWMHPQAAV